MVRPAGLPLTSGSYATGHDVGYAPSEDAAPHKLGFIVDARRKQYVDDLEELLPGTMSSYYTSPCRFLSACVGHWPGGYTNVTPPPPRCVDSTSDDRTRSRLVIADE